jgi:hypothetical protein
MDIGTALRSYGGSGQEEQMGNFYTDTIRNDPRFHLPKRVSDLQMLEPGTRQRVQQVIEDARAHGLELMAWETFRSKARQLALFERGASRLREVGVHNYGLACDIVKAVDGDPSWKGSFDLLGTLAREHGLIWGGDWGDPTRRHDFVDLVHVQRCTVARQAGLFRGDWYPEDDYDPYRDLGKK